MVEERSHADSRRLTNLAEKIKDKRYRDGYVASHTRQTLARQMREFRGDESQTEFGKSIGKPQTIVSRLEDPSYSGWSVRTLLEIAAKRNVAVFIRFVDFPTFLKYSDDMSNAALKPSSYDPGALETAIAPECNEPEAHGALLAFDRASREEQRKTALASVDDAALNIKTFPSHNNSIGAAPLAETGASTRAIDETAQSPLGALESVA